jgi:hypothetical protein
MRSKIYLILFALFAFSCSSDSSSDDGNNNNNGGNNNTGNALLVSEILVDQGQSGSMNFNYDGNKLTYISSNDFGSNELLNFIYTNNKISRIDRSYDTSQGIYSRWNFSYDNQNRLSYYEHCYYGSNNNNECVWLDTFSISYSSNNTVTQNYVYEVGSDYEDAGTLTLQLDNNGNIIGGSDSYEDVDDNGNSITVSVDASFEYDNFNSPFKNITGMNAFILLDVICRNESVYLLGFNAFNNCISRNFQYSDEEESYTDTYAYDYNDDNYPRQIIVSEENSSYEETYDISYY